MESGEWKWTLLSLSVPLPPSSSCVCVDSSIPSPLLQQHLQSRLDDHCHVGEVLSSMQARLLGLDSMPSVVVRSSGDTNVVWKLSDSDTCGSFSVLRNHEAVSSGSAAFLLKLCVHSSRSVTQQQTASFVHQFFRTATSPWNPTGFGCEGRSLLYELPTRDSVDLPRTSSLLQREDEGAISFCQLAPGNLCSNGHCLRTVVGPMSRGRRGKRVH